MAKKKGGQPKYKTETDSVGYTRYEKSLFTKLGKDNVTILIKAKVNGKNKTISVIDFKYNYKHKGWGIGRGPNEKNLKEANENGRIYKNVKKYFGTDKA